MSQWVSTAKGAHLAGRRRQDTAPEIALRRALHALGLRYRLHVRLAKGCTPDIVLPRWRTVVFVDGCFWHGCPEHGRKVPWTGPNARLWEEKLETNYRRDARATESAESLGWTVCRIWECQILSDPAGTAERIRDEYLRHDL
jgi:DNA mismatch endonuclease (patch repair protein)